MEEKTMSTKEYLAKKEQETIDELFDNAIKELREKQLKELRVKEHTEYMNNLFTSIADYESELAILESIYKEVYESEEPDTQKIELIKNDIKNMKMKLTKAQNELDRAIFKERSLQDV